MEKIFLYNPRSGSKLDSLQRVIEGTIFRNAGVTLDVVTEDNLISKLDERPDLLILPGARATRFYRTQLKDRPFEKIERRVSDGMQILGICAAAYVLAKNFAYDIYDPQTGDLQDQKHVCSEIGLADAFGHGPDINLHELKPREDNNPWSVYTAVDITFQDSYFQQSHRGALALSKGPSFSTFNASACAPIAAYDKTGDTGILAFRHGKGGGILSGPALEVGGTNLENYIRPEHRTAPQYRATIEKLEHSRTAWAELWCTLTNHFTSDKAVRAKVRQNLSLPEHPTPSRQHVAQTSHKIALSI